MRKIVGIWGAVAFVGFSLLSCKETKSEETLSTDWNKELIMKYSDIASVHSIIAVQVGKGNEVLVRLLVKSHEGEKSVWTETLTCDALIGKNGLGKTKEMKPLIQDRISIHDRPVPVDNNWLGYWETGSPLQNFIYH